MQSIISLYDGSAIKITVEDYYTPNGNNIHGIGITPDIKAELDEDAALYARIHGFAELVMEGGDAQLDAAAEYLKSKLN